jgi:ribosomal protein L11 methylase PrmA
VERLKGSFRDPSGFLFFDNKELYRVVSDFYREDYELLTSSGLYNKLVEKELLVSHNEMTESFELNAFKIIKPKLIPFVSYPYEWSFSQLKDAALLTLEIQKEAIKCGMILKDATSYNVQFLNGRPIFIDTLSFERYVEGKPWVAYKQFCQHFLAPLALMSYCDVRLSKLFRIFIDGVPIDIASKLLPFKTYFKPSLLMHVHLHAGSVKKYEDKDPSEKQINRKISKNSLVALIDNIESCVKSLKWKASGTEWVDYYQGDSYTQKGFDNKASLVKEFISISESKNVWDLGANDGYFSNIASNLGANVVSFDIDSACVENNYLRARKNNNGRILPLILDLTNPSAGIGWNNNERNKIEERGHPDLLMALALIHHISISNNVPFDLVRDYFSSIAPWLIIEFVPKSDKKVKRLLSFRKDVFDSYNQEYFEKCFLEKYEICESVKIDESDRVLYLMKRR